MWCGCQGVRPVRSAQAGTTSSPTRMITLPTTTSPKCPEPSSTPASRTVIPPASVSTPTICRMVSSRNPTSSLSYAEENQLKFSQAHQIEKNAIR